MKTKIFIFACTLCGSFLLFGCKIFQPAQQPEKEVTINGELRNLIIFYDPQIGKDDLLKAIEKYGAKVLYNYNTLNGVAIHIPGKKSLDEAVKHFEKVKGVLIVNKDEIQSIH